MFKILAPIILFSTLINIANARLIQILHTSDLHSFFENTVEWPEFGGVATLKKKIESLKAEAYSKDIPTLVLDSGDFSDGNLFYMADDGRYSYKIMSSIGYDAITIGNHDWMMGANHLNSLLKEFKGQIPLVAANVKFNAKKHPHLKQAVKPYRVFHFGDTTIAVVGATTNEFLFKWRFAPTKISSPNKKINNLAKKIKKRKDADHIMALTHIGLSKDRKLAKRSVNIDLILGGHSHDKTSVPLYFRNRRGKLIPVVHSGKFGKYITSLIVEAVKGKPLKIISHRLIPIMSDGPKDEGVSLIVQDARDSLDATYGREWLSEVIGESKIPLVTSEDYITTWAKISLDAIKESVNADIAFDSPAMFGADLPAGKITREDLFNSYPRVYHPSNKYGWSIFKTRMNGAILKLLIKAIIKFQIPVTISGVTFKLRRRKREINVDFKDVIPLISSGNVKIVIPKEFLNINSKFRIHDLRINNKKIRGYRRYSVALSEGIITGTSKISKAISKLFHKTKNSKVLLWDALITKIQKIGVITKDSIGRYNQKADNQEKTYSLENFMFIPISTIDTL